MAKKILSDSPPAQARPLSLLSVVIPARDEEGCICSTVEHLHLELRLHNVPHEIVVVDDGSTDGTWKLLADLQARLPELAPVKNEGLHGFGRAVICGLDHMKGDAAVIMMADESDDCRDVVRYWQELNRGWDCVFGSRFMKGGGVIDYPKIKLFINRLANFFLKTPFCHPAQRHHQRLQGLPARGHRGLPPAHLAALQSHRRTSAQGHRARVLLDRHPDHLAQPPHGRGQAQDPGDGQPLPVHLPLRLAGEILQPRRLQETEMSRQSPKVLRRSAQSLVPRPFDAR